MDGNEKKMIVIGEDKYKGQPIRFADKGNHYELIFTDEFNVPTSGTMSMDGKAYSIITDIVTDMRNADHEKELHIFIASYGGAVHALNMILQQVFEFRHRVAINTGMADSCGWMLTFACQERYGSPFCEYMYHEMSCGTIGKMQEIRNQNEFSEKWWKELLDRTDTVNVLTEEELKLGKTSEVYLTGAELIRRGAIRDYSEYRTRSIPMKSECWKIGDAIYVKEGEKYILCKKDTKKALDYDGLLQEANRNEAKK